MAIVFAYSVSVALNHGVYLVDSLSSFLGLQILRACNVHKKHGRLL
jgi:hypothetical protein